MAMVDRQNQRERTAAWTFSWLDDLIEKIKELLTLPNPPELVPVPVRRPPPRRPAPNNR